ncbi:hypothetical protein ElyMa_003730800 [Elysia marginata]|uniref:Uncharacterized protein n=1 Tax=Elysia marginata TaxID=1093978 RepID=A0AAV4F5V8_9GAST|nr:hypothetical protein ElyMa_003730800 [Elysia marginata]
MHLKFTATLTFGDKVLVTSLTVGSTTSMSNARCTSKQPAGCELSTVSVDVTISPGGLSISCGTACATPSAGAAIFDGARLGHPRPLVLTLGRGGVLTTRGHPPVWQGSHPLNLVCTSLLYCSFLHFARFTNTGCVPSRAQLATSV